MRFYAKVRAPLPHAPLSSPSLPCDTRSAGSHLPRSSPPMRPLRPVLCSQHRRRHRPHRHGDQGQCHGHVRLIGARCERRDCHRLMHVTERVLACAVLACVSRPFARYPASLDTILAAIDIYTSRHA